MGTNQQQNDDPVVQGIDKAVEEFLERSEKERTELGQKAEAIMSRADATSVQLDADDIDVFFSEEELKFAQESDELLLGYLENLDSDDESS